MNSKEKMNDQYKIDSGEMPGELPTQAVTGLRDRKMQNGTVLLRSIGAAVCLQI